MQFKKISFPPILESAYIPEDITILPPENSSLPIEQQHFLLYIPWEERYFELVPSEYKDFFKMVLPQLSVRTTDVHTAISLSHFDTLLHKFSNVNINKRVVILALILHDAGWSRLSEEEIANSLGVTGLKLTEGALAPKEKHAQQSEIIAREVLAAYSFEQALNNEEIELICKAVLYHDKPEAVAGAEQPMPIEVQLLVDLDHIWSFTHENFWQDTVRKGVKPTEYAKNLEKDLDGYFVTAQGKELAKELLADRMQEVEIWKKVQ